MECPFCWHDVQEHGISGCSECSCRLTRAQAIAIGESRSLAQDDLLEKLLSGDASEGYSVEEPEEEHPTDLTPHVRDGPLSFTPEPPPPVGREGQGEGVWHIIPYEERGRHDCGEPEACACEPRTVAPCVECLEREEPDPGCWNCGGEGVEDVLPQSRPLIVVHGYESTVPGYLGRFFAPHDDADEDGPWTGART